MNHHCRSPNPLRSPLARLDNDNQQQHSSTQFSSGGRTTRAVSRKLRCIFDNGNYDNDESDSLPNNNDLSSSFTSLATVSSSNAIVATAHGHAHADTASASTGTGNIFAASSARKMEKKKATLPAVTPGSIRKVANAGKTKPTTTKKCKSKSSKPKPKKHTSIGRWETWERFAFLRGLRLHGKGHWKTIGESIPTRSVFTMFAFPPPSSSL